MRDRASGQYANHFDEILPKVMHAWAQRVTAEVPITARLDPSVLTGSLPLMFARLADVVALTKTGSVVADTTLGIAHGRERALMTDYLPCDLIHELQLFRDVVLAVIDEEGVVLSPSDSRAIWQCTDEIGRDCLRGYNEVRELAHQLFNSAISSDVRNLLNVAGATAQMIEHKARDPGMASMARRIIGKIGEVDVLLMSVSTDASLTKLLKLKLTINRVMLLPLIENVCVDFEIEHQRVTIESDPIEGYWSWAAIESALRNLIVHARQFGSTAADITVSARVAFDRLLLSVHTENYSLGIGDMAVLFDRTHLQYGVAMNEQHGLLYVQEVAESHGGSLIVRSSPSVGTTFTINIPLDARAQVGS